MAHHQRRSMWCIADSKSDGLGNQARGFESPPLRQKSMAYAKKTRLDLAGFFASCGSM